MTWHELPMTADRFRELRAVDPSAILDLASRIVGYSRDGLVCDVCSEAISGPSESGIRVSERQPRYQVVHHDCSPSEFNVASRARPDRLQALLTPYVLRRP